MTKSTTCPTCEGKGWSYTPLAACRTCNGTGDIPAQSNKDPATTPAPGEVAAKPIATMDIYDGGVAKPRKGLLDDEVAAEQPEPCSGCLGITVHHTCGKQPDAYATPPTEQPEFTPCSNCTCHNPVMSGFGCVHCAPPTDQPEPRKTVTAKIVSRRHDAPQQTPDDEPNFSSMVFGPTPQLTQDGVSSPPTGQPKSMQPLVKSMQEPGKSMQTIPPTEQPEMYPCLGCEQINFDEQGNCRTCAPSTEQPCETHGMYGECPGHPGPYDPPMEARELDTYFSPQAEILSRAYDLGHHNKLDGCLVPLLEQLDALITSEANRLAGEREVAARREGIEMCHNALFHDAASVNGTITLDTGETAIRYHDLLSDPESALSAYTKGDKTDGQLLEGEE